MNVNTIIMNFSSNKYYRFAKFLILKIEYFFEIC